MNYHRRLGVLIPLLPCRPNKKPGREARAKTWPCIYMLLLSKNNCTPTIAGSSYYPWHAPEVSDRPIAVCFSCIASGLVVVVGAHTLLNLSNPVAALTALLDKLAAAQAVMGCVPGDWQLAVRQSELSANGPEHLEKLKQGEHARRWV